MGYKKSAFYSYNWLEKLFGMKMENADEIHPEWSYEVPEGDHRPITCVVAKKPKSLSYLKDTRFEKFRN